MKGGDSVKKTFLLALIGVLFLGSVLAVVLTIKAPVSAAVGSDELANSCTWTEVRLCYAGQNNGCCPAPKEKPQYD